MKPGKLYLTIFVSFTVILLVTEIAVFSIFHMMARERFPSRIRRFAMAQSFLFREAVEERLHDSRRTGNNHELQRMVEILASILRARIWIQAPGGSVICASIRGTPHVNPVGPGRVIGGVILHRPVGAFHHTMLEIPIQTESGRGRILILFEDDEEGMSEGILALILGGLGLMVAILVFPVSRFITRPVNRLRESALRIAGGDLSHRTDVDGSDELGQLGRSFNRMAESLETMIRSHRELTARVSHELRSPLTRIRVAAELLSGTADRGETSRGSMEKHLQSILLEVEEMDLLVGRILQFSKMEIPDLAPRKSSFLVSPILLDLTRRMEDAFTSRKIGLHLDLAGPETEVHGDEENFRTAVTELLDNARKFCEGEGDTRISLNAMEEGMRLVISNTATVISKEEMENLYVPFHRPGNSRAAGTGLGLAITHRIMERNGWKMEAHQEEGRFIVELNLPRSPEIRG